MGQLRRLLRARLGQRQPPGDRLPAEVRRAGGRVQGRLRHLRRAGGAAGRQGGVHRGQHLRGVDQEDVRLLGPARTTSPTRTSRRRATSSSRRSRTTSRRPSLRWFDEGRPCDTPDDEQPQKGHRQGRTSWPRRAARWSSSPRACSRTRPTTTSGRRCRTTSPAGRGTRRSWRPSTRSSSSRRTRASPSTRSTTRTCRGCRRSPGTARSRTATPTRSCACTPTTPRPEASGTATSSKLYNDRASVLLVAQVTERVRPGVVHSYEGASRYDPLEPGKAGSTDRGGCVNLLTPSRMMSKNVPGMAPNSCLVEMARWERDDQLRHGDGRHPVQRLLQLLPRLQGRVLRQRPPAVLGGPAHDRPGLDARSSSRSAAGSPRSRWTTPRSPACTATSAACVAAAADGAVYRREDGIVLIDPAKAAGQKEHRRQLPLPGHLLERGGAGRPEVHPVRAPARRRLQGAAVRGGLPHQGPGLRRPRRPGQRRVSRALAAADHRGAAPGVRPGEKVRYVGLPKSFVAGAVVLGDTDACAAGVSVTLDGRRRHGDAR